MHVSHSIFPLSYFRPRQTTVFVCLHLCRFANVHCKQSSRRRRRRRRRKGDRNEQLLTLPAAHTNHLSSSFNAPTSSVFGGTQSCSRNRAKKKQHHEQLARNGGNLYRGSDKLSISEEYKEGKEAPLPIICTVNILYTVELQLSEGSVTEASL